ncbi:MAG: hypothetical protein AAFU85_23415 [Planctomycetota bacterium]
MKRRVIFWLPAALLTLAMIVQATVWSPPPELRWDGTLREWPFPWMACCRSISSFLAVLVPYLAAWACFLIAALDQSRAWSIANLTGLVGFQLSVFCILWLRYFA